MNKPLREAIERLRTVGGLISNICFNLSQPSWPLTDHDRKTMDDLRRQWDEANSAVYDLMKPRKRGKKS